MTQDDTKLKELIDKINSLPEGQEIPDEIMSQLTQEEIIAIYVEKMIADKGVEPTDELRAELRTKLQDEITRKLVDAMPDDVVAQLNQNLDSGANDSILEATIDGAGIDVEKITADTMTAFRDSYLNGEEK